MERVTQRKGFHSEEQWKIAKAIKDGFVSVQSEMWTHRGKLTCDMVHKKVKTNPRFILQEQMRFFSEARVVLQGTGLWRMSALLFQTPISDFKEHYIKVNSR